ncbi:MAG TPA: response regulator transcription factor [Bacteroidales bacterium]|nr:response regulator transcription factor [Bacteroidales bacterium]
MPKVIICDDHAIVTDGLRSLIQSEPGWQVITSVENGRELLNALRLVKPDIVLLDVDMPVLNGLETMRLIREHYPTTKVIVLTMHDEPSLAKKFFTLGAYGYLPKNSDRDNLFATLNKVAEGIPCFDFLYGQKKPAAPSEEADNESAVISQLTDREIEILKLVTSGFSNKEIADKLNISHRTVDTHRTNMMKKLGVNNVAGLVRYAIRNGFV